MKTSKPPTAKPRSPTGPVISGVRALGAAIGASHVAAANWVKHPEWPFGSGPWSAKEIPLIKRWVAEVPGQSTRRDPDSPADMPLMSKAKLRKIVKETETIELRNKVLSGEFVSKVDSDARHLEVLQLVKRSTLGVCVGTPYSAEINEYFRRQLIDVFERLSA